MILINLIFAAIGFWITYAIIKAAIDNSVIKEMYWSLSHLNEQNDRDLKQVKQQLSEVQVTLEQIRDAQRKE